MSSRSLAAARARRANESAPPVSGNRPITSINSQAAFTQQMPANNARIAKTHQQQQQFNPYQGQGQGQSGQPTQELNQRQSKLPFQKLSVSDAVGLITLRLGRVEQWIIETEHEKEETKDVAQSIDNSILSTFSNRLNVLEQKEKEVIEASNPVPTEVIEDITKLKNDQQTFNIEFLKLTDLINKIGTLVTTHNLTVNKQAEQMLRFERELVETKDIMKTFMIKYDQFAHETAEKFTDYEAAIMEIEKNIQIDDSIVKKEEVTNVTEDSALVPDTTNVTSITSITNVTNVTSITNVTEEDKSVVDQGTEVVESNDIDETNETDESNESNKPDDVDESNEQSVISTETITKPTGRNNRYRENKNKKTVELKNV
jgi:hypothetical protein